VPSDALTIGELARRSGVAPSALRFYEEQGLIRAQRTDGNQRRYERAMLRRIAFVQAGKAAGIPLRRIGDALATLPESRIPTRRDWERASRRWRRCAADSTRASAAAACRSTSASC
jgi:MerR family transcriptional regulator, redox-sensitive transcriptional activator SoxR